MFVTNWNSTTKIQKISEITNFFRHYFLSRTEVVYKSVTCHRFLSSPLLEPVCWVTPVTRVFTVFVDVPVTPVTQRYAENSGQNHIAFLFVCLFVCMFVSSK